MQDGRCVEAVTSEKLAAVAKQQTRLDDLGRALDKLETLATFIELLDGMREIDAVKNALAATPQTRQLDALISLLDSGVKAMRRFKAGLGVTAMRLGNLETELDRIMKETGASKQLTEARARISSQLRSALEPFANEVVDVIENALAPLESRLEEIGAGLDVVCGSIRLSGGADAKELCKKTQAAFRDGLAFYEDFKTRPAKLVEEIFAELEKQLDQLIDDESRKLLDAAQARANDALGLPVARAAAK